MDLNDIEGDRCWLVPNDMRIRDILRNKAKNPKSSSQTQCHQLCSACWKGDLSNVSKLLSQSKIAGNQNTICIARCEFLSTVNMKNSVGYCALDYAVLCGYSDVEKKLLEVGAWKTIASDFKKFVLSEEFSDLVLWINGKKIPVHKVIFFSRFPNWDKLFCNDEQKLYW